MNTSSLHKLRLEKGAFECMIYDGKHSDKMPLGVVVYYLVREI